PAGRRGGRAAGRSDRLVHRSGGPGIPASFRCLPGTGAGVSEPEPPSTPPGPGGGPGARLAGLRVGVTAGRRGADVVEAFARLGASVLWSPTVGAVPAPAGAVRRETATALRARPSWVVVTTAEGLDR